MIAISLRIRLVVLSVLLFLMVIYFVGCEQENPKDSPNKIWFVTGINTELFASEYLFDWKYENERICWTYGREYRYTSTDSSKMIFIRIGIYDSKETASKRAREYRKDVSIYFEEKPAEFPQLGDSSWYWMPSSDPYQANDIIFIRNNTTIALGTYQGEGCVYQIAKEIDDGILNRQEFISTDTSIAVPVIDSIELTRMDDGAKFYFKVIIYTKSNPEDSLEYQFISSKALSPTDEYNQFVTPIISKTPGTFKIQAMAMSPLNLVSEAKVKSVDY